MFSALAMNHGNLQNKLNSFIAFAPIAQLKYTSLSMLTDAAKLWKQLESTMKLLNSYEINNPKTDSQMRLFCIRFPTFCGDIKSFLNMESSPYNEPAREEVLDYRP
jgi:hypothetical protein